MVDCRRSLAATAERGWTDVTNQPDLILVMTDQQRSDQIGYAPSSPVRTPNLDRLAASGVIFENAYSAATTCVPARTALMTGLFEHRTPYIGPFTLDPTFFTVPHALRAAGYQTALIGKMHFNPMKSSHGFEHIRACEHLDAYRVAPEAQPELDHYHDFLRQQGLHDWRFEEPLPAEGTYPFDPRTHPTSWVERETLDFLAERDTSRPLFLVVSFPHPHPPVNPPEPYASMYDPADSEVDPRDWERNAGLPSRFVIETTQFDRPQQRVRPDRIDWHRARLARTYGLITQIDDSVGRIVDRLDLDGALLFFTSDHGDYGGHRGLIDKTPWIPFDDLAKVACFAAGGLVEGRRTESGLMQSFDLAATFLDHAGIEVDLDELDSRSLRGFLSDPDATLPEDRMVFSALSQPWPMVRWRDHKYIRERGFGEEVLFDLAHDPIEHVNYLPLDPQRRLLGVLSDALDEQLSAGTPTLPSFPGG